MFPVCAVITSGSLERDVSIGMVAENGTAIGTYINYFYTVSP